MLRQLFFLLTIKPLALLVLGLNVRRRGLLPPAGPAIVAANHNSHLDTLVLMSLFPLALLPRVRPVAAADYFLRNRWLAWFALNLIGIIPLDRAGRGAGTLAPVAQAIERGDILILFPEGSRGEPEQLGRFKNGIAHLVSEHPEVPVTPVFLHGLGKSLPKGECVLVPFFIDVFVGEAVRWSGRRHDFMEQLEGRMHALQDEARIATWDAEDPRLPAREN